MLEFNKIQCYSFMFMFFCIFSSAFSTPRSNHALIDIACNAVELAKRDNNLSNRIKLLVGEDTFNSNGQGVKQKLTKLQRSKLEQVRDALNPEHKRWIVARSFHEFFNPTNDNASYGTLDYANLLDELVKTNDRTNAENVTFESNHKEFCRTFRTHANTTPFKLGMNLKTAYEQIKDNNTKAAVKPVLSTVGLSSIKIIKRRIDNNNKN